MSRAGEALAEPRPEGGGARRLREADTPIPAQRARSKEAEA